MSVKSASALEKKRYLLERSKFQIEISKLELETRRLKQGFLNDEYKEKWKYLQHMEEMRHKQFVWFIAIFGGSFGWLLKDSKSFAAQLQKDEFLIALAFLTLYASLLCLLFTYQKVSYSHYVRRLCGIETSIGVEANTAAFKTPFLTVFQFFLAAPAFMRAFAFSALFYGLTLVLLPAYLHPIPLGVVSFIAYATFFVVIAPRYVFAYAGKRSVVDMLAVPTNDGV